MSENVSHDHMASTTEEYDESVEQVQAGRGRKRARNEANWKKYRLKSYYDCVCVMITDSHFRDCTVISDC